MIGASVRKELRKSFLLPNKNKNVLALSLITIFFMLKKVGIRKNYWSKFVKTVKRKTSVKYRSPKGRIL